MLQRGRPELGLPAYRWDVMRASAATGGSAARQAGVALFDLFRVDHVVGLFRSWIFPRDGRAPHFDPPEKLAQLAQAEPCFRPS